MKRLLAISFFLLFFWTFSAAQGDNHALIIAISSYPEGSGWRNINCSKDVELISSTLLANGFQKENITILEDSRATKINIVSALCAMEKNCRPGDSVFIHFSCHGQQITDINGDEDDGLDEALIPYDAAKTTDRGYLGENHLTDDELNFLLSRIRSRIGNDGVILVLSDACHSGNNTRDDEDLQQGLRGTKDIFEVTSKAKSRLRTILKKHSLERGDGLSASYSKASNKAVGSIDWVPVSACSPDKSNYEVIGDGFRCGRLSYAFSRCFHKGMTVSELVSALQEQYRAIPFRAYGPRPVPFTDDIPEQLTNIQLF